MFGRGFNAALADSLEALRMGATVEQCLRRYPKHQARLAPLLAIAAQVQRSPRVTARPEARERSWQLVRERAHKLRAGGRRLRLSAPRVSYGWLKPVALAAVVALFLASAGGSVVYASQDALPNSPLYRVKLASEDVRLWFVFDDSQRAQILLGQSDERVEEILQMVRRGEDVPASALGAMQDRNEEVAAIVADRPEDTELRARVLTHAQEQEDLLIALSPQVPEEAHPELTRAVAQLHNTRLGSGGAETVPSLRPEELSGGLLTISGAAEQVEGETWLVGGVEVSIDERTIGGNELATGSTAALVVARSSNGRLQALSLGSAPSVDEPGSAIVSGAVEDVSEDGVSVGGQWIPISDRTLQTLKLKKGARVQITIEDTPEGIVAGSVRPASAATSSNGTTSFSFEGTATGDISRAAGMWDVGGFKFVITPSTTFDARGGAVRDGARVQLDAINNGEELQALRVSVLSSEDAEDTATIIGAFERFDSAEGVWYIGGLPVVPPETGADPPEGALVIVEAERDGADLVATDVTVVEEPQDEGLVQVRGTIGEVDGSRWRLEFGQVRVTSTADVTGGEPQAGVRVIVWGERGTDGNVQARFARVLDDAPIAGVATPAPEGEDASSE